MEQVLPNALERIENPILLILLAALLIAVVALWISNKSIVARFVDLVVETIGAIKDQILASSRQRDLEEANHQTLLTRFDALDRRLDSLEKKTVTHEA